MRFVFGTLIALSLVLQPANAQWFGGNNDNSAVSDQLRSMDKSAGNIARNVQFFLTANNRWYPTPQGRDLALWSQLEALKNQLKQARRAADGGDQKRLLNQLAQLQVVASNTAVAAQQAGFDAGTVSQLQLLQNSANEAIVMVQSAPVVVPGNQYSGGWNRGQNGMQLLNAERIGADMVTVTWTTGFGGTATYTSKINSYMLSDGASVRSAFGNEVNLLRSAYNASSSMIPTPYPSGYYPTPYVPSNTISASSSGKGQFVVGATPFMLIRNASLQSADPITGRATFSIYGGKDTINFSGAITARNQRSAMMRIDGSDRGPASGTINCNFGFNGGLASAQATGTFAGQPLSISFNGQ